MHATQFLSEQPATANVPVIVLHGAERSLISDVLHRLPGCAAEYDQSHEDVSFTRFEGDDVRIVDVLDELSTISMFGDRRVVLVDHADGFVTENRPRLEAYVASPVRSGLLILDVESWPKTTRLAKAVEQTGLAVECSALSGAPLLRWLQDQARSRFEKDLERDAAALMVELAGPALGILQRELEKLAALAGEAPQITVENVRQAVGDWRTQTTWAMLDAVCAGRVGAAVENLDRLLLAGEPSVKIMGGVTFVFRKLAQATEIARRTRDVRQALSLAGVYRSSLAGSEKYLRRIGYEKASHILQLLADADASLRGASRVDERLLLEHLFVQLAG